MRTLIQEISGAHTPESLVEQLRGEPGIVLLRSGLSIRRRRVIRLSRRARS